MSERGVVYPRVNAAMIKKFKGQQVLFVGRTGDVQNGEGVIDVQAPDGPPVQVHVVDAEDQVSPQQIYEFLAVVDDDLTLREQARFPFSDNFDLSLYNQMLLLTHDAKYASMFWGS